MTESRRRNYPYPDGLDMDQRCPDCLRKGCDILYENEEPWGPECTHPDWQPSASDCREVEAAASQLERFVGQMQVVELARQKMEGAGSRPFGDGDFVDLIAGVAAGTVELPEPLFGREALQFELDRHIDPQVEQDAKGPAATSSSPGADAATAEDPDAHRRPAFMLLTPEQIGGEDREVANNLFAALRNVGNELMEKLDLQSVEFDLGSNETLQDAPGNEPAWISGVRRQAAAGNAWAQRMLDLMPQLQEYLRVEGREQPTAERFILTWHGRDRDGDTGDCWLWEGHGSLEDAMVAVTNAPLNSEMLPGYLLDLQAARVLGLCEAVRLNERYAQDL